MSQMLSDLSSERGILAGICRYGKDAYLDAADLVQPEHFTSSTNQSLASVLYSILQTDLECKIDLHKIFAIAADLGLQGQISDGQNVQYVDRILSYNVELSNVRDFAKRVRVLAETRHIIGLMSDTAGKLTKTVTGKESIAQVVSLAESDLLDYTNKMVGNEQGVQQIGLGLDEYIDVTIKEQKENGRVSVGYPIWEEAIGGINPGVHLLTGRPKVFKTTHAMNSALFCAGKQKIPCLVVDGEMSLDNGQWARSIAMMTQIPFNNIFTGNLDEIQRKKVNTAVRYLKNMPLHYVTVSGKEFDEIISLIRRWLIQTVQYNSQGKINNCLVIYDYLKLNNSSPLKEMTEWQELGFRVSALHELTVKYKIPIILYSQLNRTHDIAASDRLRWFSSSICTMQRKSEEEIAEDGPEGGNRKLIVEDCRFGGGLDYGDYINYNLFGQINKLSELTTRNILLQSRQNEEVEV